MTTLIPKYTKVNTSNRTIAEKFSESISILDYGADPTGVVDSTVAINAAIDAAIGVSTLYIPSGTYKYTGTGKVLTGSLVMRGEGITNSVLNINADGVIFNIATTIDNPLILSGIKFNLINPTTNTDATLFYTSNGVNFGSCFQVSQCSFQNWTNTTIHAIRAFNSSMKDCTIQGPDAYNATSGYLSGKNSAGIRVWGADGTLTLQDHSFSNLCVFERITVKNVLYGFDFWNINVASITACTFERAYIGAIIRPNPTPAVAGLTSSTEKGGFGYALCYFESCWFEDIFLLYIANVNYNPVTGLPVDPTRAAVINQANGGQTNYINDDAKAGGNLYPTQTFRGGVNFYNVPGIGTSSTLHDYEEGSWTPVIVTFTGGATNPTITYTTQIGRYTKIGNIVTVSADIVCTTVTGGTPSGGVIINGLPYEPEVLNGTGTFSNLSNFDTLYANTNGQLISPSVAIGLPYVFFVESSAAGSGSWTVDKILANFTCRLMITYQTSAGS